MRNHVISTQNLEYKYPLNEDEWDEWEPDFYALGYDSALSGKSSLASSTIQDFGSGAVDLWNKGYNQGVKDIVSISTSLK